MSESLGMSEETFNYDRLIAGDYPVMTKQVTIKSGDGSHVRGTALGKIKKKVGTPTYGGSNTGNGTVGSITMGLLAKIGNYVLTCVLAIAQAMVAATTGTADGGNTGNGTCTGVTAGDKAKKGTYTLECIAAPAGTPSVPTEGTADGGNTGNGTMGTVSGGAEVQAGVYTFECTNADVEGTEIWKVIDPDGNRLKDCTTAVAYITSQILATITAGVTGFAVGDKFTVTVTAVDGDSGTFKVTNPDGVRLDDATVGTAYTSEEINLTINDGSTDYAVGDKFTIAVGNGGVFQVVDPDGHLLPPATVGVAYSNSQLNFTVADGSTDFEVGDTITIPIEAPLSDLWVKSLAAAVDGSQEIDCILAEAADASSAAVTKIAYETGEFNEDRVTFGTGHTAATVKETLKAKNIYLKDPVAA